MLSDSLIYVHNAKTTYICTVPFDRPPLPALVFSSSMVIFLFTVLPNFCGRTRDEILTRQT